MKLPGEFIFNEMNLADTEDSTKSTPTISPQKFLHMAAQAGVRYSIENPQVYVDSNLKAFERT